MTPLEIFTLFYNQCFKDNPHKGYGNPYYVSVTDYNGQRTFRMRYNKYRTIEYAFDIESGYLVWSDIELVDE